MELIVVSDLHLSVGYDEKTGRYSRNEDFFFDEEFKRFLEYLHKAKSPKKHLIIDGDLFDFLQVDGCKTKELDEEGGAPFKITPKERKFGLGTEEDKTVWKLGVIADGHPVFFQALANFLSKGNHLSIITGNHDIELYWPQVQEALRDRIANLFENTSMTEQQQQQQKKKKKKESIKALIDFYPWFYYDKDHKTYIEHGNQYDRLNSFQYFLYPLIEHGSDKLWLPFGSFFVRYFFNKLEISNPFADNIKPPTKYMRWAWKENKLQFLKTVLLYLPTMIRVFLKGGKLSKAKKELLEKENDKIIDELAQKFGLQSDAVKKIYSLKARPFTRNKLLNILSYSTFSFIIIAIIVSIVLFVPLNASLQTSLYSFGVLIVPLIRWFLKFILQKDSSRKILEKIFVWIQKHLKVPTAKWFLKFLQKDPYEKILPKIKEHLEKEHKEHLEKEHKEHLEDVGIDVQTIVFGHTHDPDIRIVAADCKYFNTGTWTTVFSEEERIIREAKQFAFVWIKKEKDGAPQATLHRWNDCLERHEKLILFEPKP
jgi:UDP-2,3-diacylglucosamine pyrophosphatase LpxH